MTQAESCFQAGWLKTEGVEVEVEVEVEVGLGKHQQMAGGPQLMKKRHVVCGQEVYQATNFRCNSPSEASDTFLDAVILSFERESDVMMEVDCKGAYPIHLRSRGF